MVLALSITLLCSPFTHADETSLYAEWRARSNAHLAELLPKRKNAGTGATGVSIIDLAEVLGVSIPRASMLLSREDRHLSYVHADKIAARFGVDADDIMAVEVMDRFKSVRELDAALADEPPALLEFFIHLYARRLIRTSPHVDAEPMHAQAFLARWQAEVRRRLLKLSDVDALAPDRPLTHLMQVLGQSKSVGVHVAKGRRHVTYAHARAVAEAYAVTPEWILAADMFSEFKSLGQVERTFRDQGRSLRALLLRLAIDRLGDCHGELAAIAS